MSGADPLDVLRDAIDGAPEAPMMALPGQEPMNGHGGDDDLYRLPPDCPVTPLGYSADMQGNQICYYLDSNGIIHGLGANNKHGAGGIQMMFGTKGMPFLLREFGKWTAPKKERDKETGEWVPIPGTSRLDGFKVDKARDALINACQDKGFFVPAGKLRGRGAHRSDAGHLILHFGDRLLVPKERATGAMEGMVWADPGVHGGYVYPAGDPCLRPWAAKVSDDPAIRLLSFLQTWSWKRPLIDPIFVLGQIGASYLGGALDWRPTCWITGNRGTGKSTLDGKPSRREGLIGHLLGKGVFNSTDPTPSSIRRMLNNSTVPVIIDEAEAEINNDKILEMVKLARISAGGGDAHRTAQDMSVDAFMIKSSFWFSGIVMPPIPAQDRSRMAVCELRPLRADVIEPDYFHAWGSKNMPIKEPASQIGAKLLRRMIDSWGRLDATVDWFRSALKSQGHDSRGTDVFGTLLACAWVMLHDNAPAHEDVIHWLDAVRPDTLVEVSGATSEERGCLEHLLTSIVQSTGGEEREALGDWLGKALSMPLLEGGDKYARRMGSQFGLKLVNARRYAEARDIATGEVIKKARWGAVSFMDGQPGYLAIAARHEGLGSLYRGTKWASGGWNNVLSRIDGAIEGVKLKFGSGGAAMSLTATLVPLYAVFGAGEDGEPDGLPVESREAAARAWVAKQMEGEA
jgi:hypothetical protein